MRQLKLFSWQYYTFKNYGDTILAEAIRYLFNSFGNREYFRVMDGKDSRYPIGPRLADIANQYDAGLIAGGGVIIPRNLDLSGWAFSSSVATARTLRRTIVFAVGYNLYRQHKSLPAVFKKHFEAIAENSPFIGMRDPDSVEKIKDIISSKYHRKVVFQPCPTTFLPYLVEEVDQHHAPDLGDRVSLQVSITDADDKDRILSELLRACHALRRQGLRIELVSFFDKFDMEFVDYLRSHGFHEFSFMEMNTEGQDILSGPRHFNDVPVVVSTRGHGAMVPFGAGSVVIPIGVSPKMEYFARQVQSQHLLIDVDDPNLADRVVAQVGKVRETYSAEVERHHLMRRQMYDISLDNLAHIYHSLTGDTPADKSVMPLNEFEVFLSGRLHAKTVALEGKTRGPGAPQNQAKV